MIVRDSKNREVEIQIYGTPHGDVDILAASFVDSRIDASGEDVELELDYIRFKYHKQIVTEWRENIVPVMNNFFY